MKHVFRLYFTCVLPMLIVGGIVAAFQFTGVATGIVGEYILFMSCFAGTGFIIMLVLTIIFDVYQRYEKEEIDG